MNKDNSIRTDLGLCLDVAANIGYKNEFTIKVWRNKNITITKCIKTQMYYVYTFYKNYYTYLLSMHKEKSGRIRLTIQEPQHLVENKYIRLVNQVIQSFARTSCRGYCNYTLLYDKKNNGLTIRNNDIKVTVPLNTNIVLEF